MTTIVGGLRTRLIKDSAFQVVQASVAALGWMDTGRRHTPVTFRATPVPFDEQVPFNTVSVAAAGMRSEEAEMGSNLSDDTHTFYVDLYAESDDLGTHLIYDIRDILRGKMPSIGRGAPVLPVSDYNHATPTVIFTCQIEDVMVDRANDFPKPWQRYWYVCRFDVVDTYGDENYG